MSTPEKHYLSDFLTGKSEHTLALFNHFMAKYNTIGPIEALPLKSMIGLDNGHKSIVYITQLGKNFIHIVFPFKQAYPDNLCFQKIAQVPGQQQFNHHFRMLSLEDFNEEVMSFMQMAYDEEG